MTWFLLWGWVGLVWFVVGCLPVLFAFTAGGVCAILFAACLPPCGGTASSLPTPGQGRAPWNPLLDVVFLRKT